MNKINEEICRACTKPYLVAVGVAFKKNKEIKKSEDIYCTYSTLLGGCWC
jgi:hypothetical protein